VDPPTAKTYTLDEARLMIGIPAIQMDHIRKFVLDRVPRSDPPRYTEESVQQAILRYGIRKKR
jgi:hypothetical protein